MLEAYFNTTFSVFQPAALDTLSSQIVRHAISEKNKLDLLLFMSAHALPLSKLIPPFTKIDPGKTQSYDMKKEKSKFTENTTHSSSKANKTLQLFNS